MTLRERWLVVKKRGPALLAFLSTTVGALTQAAVLPYVPPKLGGPLVLFGAALAAWTKSVKPGSHGVDYEVGLVPERRGAGTPALEFPPPGDAP